MYGVGSSPLPAVTTGDCLVMESSSRYPHIHHLPPPTHTQPDITFHRDIPEKNVFSFLTTKDQDKLQENKKQEVSELRMLLFLLQLVCYLGVLTVSLIRKRSDSSVTGRWFGGAGMSVCWFAGKLTNTNVQSLEITPTQ